MFFYSYISQLVYKLNPVFLNLAFFECLYKSFSFLTLQNKKSVGINNEQKKKQSLVVISYDIFGVF